MTLVELAERVEAAEGPDRELDREIAREQVYWILHGMGEEKAAEIADAMAGARLDADLDAYTASLDAALTLVPEGWPVFHLFNCHLGPDRWIWEADLAPQRSYANILRGQAATPALALCAASLRARASLEASDGQS